MNKKNFFKLNDKGGHLNKRWFIYWNIDSKRFKRYGSINRAKTKEERYKLAEELIKALEKEFDLGDIKRKPDPTFGKIEKYLLFRKKIWRHKTYQSIKSHFTIFKNWLGYRPINSRNIQNFYDHLIHKGLNPTTYNNYTRGMTMVFKALNIPCPTPERLKNSPSPAGYFVPSQIRYLSQEIPKFDEDLWFFVQFVYYCFLRPGRELRLLKVGDILLEEKKILVRSENSKNKKQQYVTIPKVFLPTVQKHIENRKPMGYVFYRGSEDVSVSRDYYSKLHRKCLLKLGFDTKRYKLYSWKHTGAVMAVKAKIHIKQLQIQLRHHSLDQVNQYLRQLGVEDIGDLHDHFPEI